MRRPRVALISHIYLEKRYRGKLDFLANEVDLELISPNRYPFPYGQYVADFSEQRKYGVRVYPLRFPLGWRSSTRWVLASGDLGFRGSAPDIIHVENEASSFSLLQALVYRRLFAPKAKVVVSIWANQELTGLKSFVLKPLARLMRSSIDFYVTGNQEGSELLIRAGITSDRIVVMPLVGTDTDFYTSVSPGTKSKMRTEQNLGAEDFVIGFVGRFVEDKGLMDLVEAFRLLKRDLQDYSLRLLCVGDGPLKSVLASQGPDVRVVSPGGDGKVLHYYRMMDALILPSRTLPHWKEQFGMVLVEGMACGLPLIGSSSGAIPEVIGDAGYIFPEGNVSALTAVLRDLIVSTRARHEIIRKGELRAKKFNHKAVAEQMLSVYRSLSDTEDRLVA